MEKAAPMVGDVFSLKSFCTNRQTRDDLPTAASPEMRQRNVALFKRPSMHPGLHANRSDHPAQVAYLILVLRQPQRLTQTPAVRPNICVDVTAEPIIRPQVFVIRSGGGSASNYIYTAFRSTHPAGPA